MKEKQSSQEVSYFQHSKETNDLRETGIPWLGEIPTHWDVSKVKWQFDVQLGKMLDEDDISGDDLAPYLRNKDVQWWNINTGNLPQMDFDPAERRKYNLRSGDVLVCEGGEIGRSAVWTNDEIECYYQKALHRVRPLSSNQNSKFFCYFMQFAAGNGVFVANTNRSTIGHLTATKLKNQEIPIPPEREQNLIVDFLDRRTARIDALVEKQKRLLDLLDEKRQAFITRAVTVGLDSTVMMKSTDVGWLDKIPEHWKIAKLKWITSKIGSGVTPDGGSEAYVEDGVTFLRSQNVHFDGLRLDDVACIDEKTNAEMAATQVESGDVLLNITGASIGRCSRVPPGFPPANVNQHVCIIRPRQNRVDSTFLNYAISSRIIQNQILSDQEGASREAVTFTQIGNFLLPLPPIDEQKEIATDLDKRADQISLLSKEIKKSIDLHREKRQALITAAVTGQIDVTEERGETHTTHR